MENTIKGIQNQVDKRIIELLKLIMDSSADLSDRKGNCRKIVEKIVSTLFTLHVKHEDFVKRNQELWIQNNTNRNILRYDPNKFKGKLFYLINEVKLIPHYYEYSFIFLWSEGSRCGAHEDENKSVDAGLVLSIESMIIFLNDIVVWYFYTYRGFYKADLPIESMFENYYSERLPYLNKKTHKGFLVTAIASGLLLISTCVFGILYFSEKQDFQKLQTEYTITSLQQEKTIRMFSDSLNKSKRTENISNGPVGRDLTFGDKFGGDKIGGDKVEIKSVKYNTEKGNIYSIPSGDIKIDKGDK